MITIGKLKTIFDVKDDKDLAALFGRKKGAASVWKRTGVPATIERRAYELMRERGIVFEPETPYGIEKKQDPPKVNPVVVACMDDAEFLKLPVEKQVALIYQMMRNLKDQE